MCVCTPLVHLDEDCTQGVRLPREEENSPSKCCHHWVIQPADGPESRGLCQVCGEVRDFKNYVEGGKWGNTSPAGRPSTESLDAEPKPAPQNQDGDEEEEG